MSMGNNKAMICDMNEVSKDLKKLDKDNQKIITSVIACLLARQQMEQEKQKEVS